MNITNRIVAIVISIVCFLSSGAHPGVVGAETGGTTVVHLSHYSDDVHAVLMALKIATMLQEKDGGVSIFVDLEGARLSDKRVPSDLKWGQSTSTVGELLKTFVDAGGAVRVCPHCAKAAGIEKSNLREGCAILTPEELGNLLSGADKIMDY